MPRFKVVATWEVDCSHAEQALVLIEGNWEGCDWCMNGKDEPTSVVVYDADADYHAEQIAGRDDI